MEIDEITKDIFGPDVFLESTNERCSKKSKHSSRYFYYLTLISSLIQHYISISINILG